MASSGYSSARSPVPKRWCQPRPRHRRSVRLAAESEISVISPFFAAASEHAIGPDGTLVVRDLDAGAVYRGVVIVPGRAPVVGEIRDLPRRLELPLGDGLTVAGRQFAHLRPAHPEGVVAEAALGQEIEIDAAGRGGVRAPVSQPGAEPHAVAR